MCALQRASPAAAACARACWIPSRGVSSARGRTVHSLHRCPPPPPPYLDTVIPRSLTRPLPFARRCLTSYIPRERSRVLCHHLHERGRAVSREPPHDRKRRPDDEACPEVLQHLLRAARRVIASQTPAGARARLSILCFVVFVRGRAPGTCCLGTARARGRSS